jgi:uncharacterized protein YggE
MATIKVRGHAVVPADPDDAELALELSAVRPTPDDAYTDVAARSERLEALFGELDIRREARSTAGVAIREHREYDQQGRPQHRGYVAASRVIVRLGDPSLLARLMREAVTRVEARVAGPAWRLAPDNPARLEAYRDAALDARRKAEACAAALGLRLGSLLEAQEPAADVREAFGLAMLDSIDQPEIPVTPARLDARAVLEVTFALEQP